MCTMPPLANYLSALFPDRPSPDLYRKYDDPLLTDRAVDAAHDREKHILKRAGGCSLLPKLLPKLAARLKGDWSDVDDFRESERPASSSVTTEGSDSDAIDIDKVVAGTKFYRKCVAMNQTAKTQSKTDMWSWDTANFKDPGLKERHAAHVPGLFDVVVAMQLPQECATESVTVSLWCATYHVADVSVTKEEPTLFLEGAHPCLLPKYHDCHVTTDRDVDELLVYGCFCAGEVLEVANGQLTDYELEGSESVYAVCGGMGFKVVSSGRDPSSRVVRTV